MGSGQSSMKPMISNCHSNEILEPKDLPGEEYFHETDSRFDYEQVEMISDTKEEMFGTVSSLFSQSGTIKKEDFHPSPQRPGLLGQTQPIQKIKHKPQTNLKGHSSKDKMIVRDFVEKSRQKNFIHTSKSPTKQPVFQGKLLSQQQNSGGKQAKMPKSSNFTLFFLFFTNFKMLY